MPDPDHDAEPERRTDPRYDAWPVQRYDAHTRWPVERASPGEGEDRRAESLEWVGVFHSGETPSGTYVYDREDPALVEGRIDEEGERIVVEEDHDRRELDDGESLGEHLEAIGEEHGWTWLSSFAREYLEDDDQRQAHERLVEPRAELTYEHSSFDRKNLLDSSPQDLAFVASHAFSDERDRAYVLEREFDVVRDEAADEVRITVREDLREATGEKRDRQAGDAALTDRDAFELAVDVDADADDPAWESPVEEAIEAWHRDHRGPTTGRRAKVGRADATPGRSPGE